jgi:peroxiredoxin
VRSDSLYQLPPDLPVPADDGACDHLTGMTLPPIALPSTEGRFVRLDDVTNPRTVVYCYPRTGLPDQDPPGGLQKWDAIPGARGCTPQSCAYRDHYHEIRSRNTQVFGLSTQTTEYQQEMAGRLHLPFEILSDADLRFCRALNLPTFQVDDMILLKRATLILNRGRIEHVFYPVFPADQDARQVLSWLDSQQGQPNALP